MILGTLVGQGLTFPTVIRLVDIGEDGLADKEEAKARIRAAQAALERLDEIAEEGWAYDDTLERARGSTTSASAATGTGSTRRPTARAKRARPSTSGSDGSSSPPSAAPSSTSDAGG